MGILSLSISFVVIAIILCVFLFIVKKDENNVRYVVSMIHPRDNVIPKQVIQAGLVRMLTGGLVILALTFIVGLIFIHFFTFAHNVLIAHILLIIPILIFALMFRSKLNRLDQEYQAKGR